VFGVETHMRGRLMRVLRIISGVSRRPARWTTCLLMILVSCLGAVLSQQSSAVASSPDNWYESPGIPLATSDIGSQLSVISCSSTNFCMATGTQENRPIRETLHDQTWTVDRGLSSSDWIDDVSCPADGTCFGLGGDTSTNPRAPLAFSYVNGGWTTTPLTGQATQLRALSCPTVDWCSAIGVTGSGNIIIGSFSGGVWTATDAGFTGTGPLGDLSCPTTTYCAAVGQKTNNDDGNNVMVQVNNGVVTVSDAPSGYLSSLACPATGTCYAVGGANNSQTAFSFTDGMWQPMAQPPPQPDGAGPVETAFLSSVSCSSSVSCVAVGNVVLTSAPEISLVETLSDGTWVRNPNQQLSSQRDAPADVSCASSFCLGVGLFVDVHGISQPMVMGQGPDTPLEGYWLVASDGGIFTFGNAGFYGSMGGKQLNQPVVGMAATPDGDGYWLVASDGGIFTFGDAGFYGSMGGQHLNQPVVGMAATPDGNGYWLVASDGGIFTFGDARFYGSMGGQHLNQPVVGMAEVSDGSGYWELARDGGIFTFGDAYFWGASYPWAQHVGITAPKSGQPSTTPFEGYWTLSSTGGVFTFGDTSPRASQTSPPLPTVVTSPFVGIDSMSDNSGLWLAQADGSVYAFNGATYYGSMAGNPLNRPIVGIAGTSNPLIYLR
jgi:hypothetical protein